MNLNYRLFSRFSTSRFHQMLGNQLGSVISQTPEDLILSRFVGSSAADRSSNDFIGEQKLKNSAVGYKEFLSSSPYGSVVRFIKNNHDITLVSMNYFRAHESKLKKLLFHADPDAILVQRRPEWYINNFSLLPKGQDGIFSDRLYLDQLKLHSYSKGLQQVSKGNKTQLTGSPPAEQLQKQLLNEKGLTASLQFAQIYGSSLYLGQLPMRSYRQWLANTHTLMELQEMFKNICRRLPRYANMNLTPYKLGTLLYPDSFLKKNDQYMATLIQMMIATKRYNRIVGIMSIMQNEAVKNILEAGEGLDPIINILVPPKPKGTLVRNIEDLEVIQKHILMDVLFEGQKVAEVPIRWLQTTASIIQMYGKNVSGQSLRKFRYDKTVEYLELMKKKISEGQQEMKKQFVRETIRGPKV